MRGSALLAAPAKAKIRFRYGQHRSSSAVPASSAASPVASSSAPSSASGATAAGVSSTVTLRPHLSEAEIAAVNTGIAWI